MLNNLVLCKYSFNVKKQLQSYVTIQLSVNTDLMSKKQFYFQQFSQAQARSSNVSTVQLSKTFLLQAIQFTQTIQFSISMLLVLFNP